jgi:hypothetical protein
MPLFEISEGELVPFRRLKGGADLYEKEIERLVWENLEEFTGEALFPVARQARTGHGGVADIVALDKSGRVVVFEVKRDIDRKQLAQCLEYAGWARTTSLDELAGLYHGGTGAFFSAWQEFTESSSPLVVNPHPRLFLVARDFLESTESAFDFLVESGVPVVIVRVALFEDETQRRFIDVSGEHEPELRAASGEGVEAVDYTRIEGRPIKIADLMEAELLVPGDELIWERPQKGDSFEAIVGENGALQLRDGRAFSTPSRAAMEAASVVSCDGWYAWKVKRAGKLLHELRKDLVMQIGAE